MPEAMRGQQSMLGPCTRDGWALVASSPIEVVETDASPSGSRTLTNLTGGPSDRQTLTGVGGRAAVHDLGRSLMPHLTFSNHSLTSVTRWSATHCNPHTRPHTARVASLRRGLSCSLSPRQRPVKVPVVRHTPCGGGCISCVTCGDGAAMARRSQHLVTLEPTR